MVVILDTNFLIYLIKHRLADEARALGRLVVPESVVKELKKPSLGGEASKHASAALELIGKWGLEVMAVDEKNVDDSIVGLAEKLKKTEKEVLVATSDEELASRLGAKGIKTIGIKRGKTISGQRKV